jgi:large subunit ribosomal protein L22
MVTRAVLRYVRISPRKFRLIIPLVRGRSPEEALAVLMSVKKKASIYAIELLKSAIASAKRKQGVDLEKLYISRMTADCGPTLKRFRAASMGRASSIRKRTSHITLELDNRPAKAEAGLKAAAKAGAKAEVKGKKAAEVKHESGKKPVKKR